MIVFFSNKVSVEYLATLCRSQSVWQLYNLFETFHKLLEMIESVS